MEPTTVYLRSLISLLSQACDHIATSYAELRDGSANSKVILLQLLQSCGR
jgi:hypothetical protein